MRNLALKLEEIVTLVFQNPNIFQVSDIKKEIRRVIILSHNTLYCRIVANQIEIISFFSNRQSPKKRKLK